MERPTGYINKGGLGSNISAARMTARTMILDKIDRLHRKAAGPGEASAVPARRAAARG